jgi:GMP synthase-like glutamine amidotransferase
MEKIAIVRNDTGYVGQYITGRLVHSLQRNTIVINAWEAFPQDVEKWALQENINGIVLTGSLDSVNDKCKWIEEELSFIKDVINQEIPILGICFGHQLLGKYFGINVERKVFKSGLIEIELIQKDVLFKGITNFKVPVSHGEHVSEIPKNFELLATSDYCKIQAMKHKNLAIYGIQFHPCYDENVKKIKELEITDENYGEHDGAKIIHNFAHLICKA